MFCFASVLVALLLPVAYVPGIEGAATSPRWALAALSAYFLSLPALLFAAWPLYFLDSPDAAYKWAIVAAAYCWGTRTDDEAAGKVARAFALGIGAEGCLAAAQWLGFGLDSIPTLNGGFAGTFANKNYLGEAACASFVVGMRFSAAAALASVPALVLSGCRSAWLAALVAFGVNAGWRWTWLWLVAAAFVVWRADSDLLGGGSSMALRFELWRDAAPVVVRGLPFGAGAPLEPLHNEFLQVWSELGVVAAAPLALFYLAACRDAAFGAGVAVLLSFGFALHLPATAWLVAFVCGHLVGGLRHDGRVGVRSARLEAGAAVVPALRA